MNEELYNFADPPISADIGWQQMEIILKKHLPVRRKIPGGRLLFYYTPFALCITIFLLASLKSGDNFLTHDKGGNGSISLPAIDIPAISQGSLRISKVGPSLFKPVAKNTFYQKEERPLFLNEARMPSTSENRIVDPAGNMKEKYPVETMLDDQVAYTGVAAITAQVKTSVAGSGKSARGKDANRLTTKGSWNLYGGIGMNAGMNGTQNLQPYPLAEARFNISRRYYVAAGVSVWAPVSTSARGISKTFYQNDANNSRLLYNETTLYSGFHYADIPLSAGMNITKNISIQGGIQMSVLLQKKVTKFTEPYDFQLSSMTAPIGFPVLIVPPNNQKEYDVEIHPVDYRLVTGIRYAFNKTMLGFGYQHGLRSLGNGINMNKSNNHVFSLNLLFQIR